jgi:hypothetical protein
MAWILIDGLIDELTAVCQGEFSYRITEATKNVSNRFDQEHHEQPVSPKVSPAYPVIAPPSVLISSS